jgi:hypothetical protein
MTPHRLNLSEIIVQWLLDHHSDRIDYNSPRNLTVPTITLYQDGDAGNPSLLICYYLRSLLEVASLPGLFSDEPINISLT